ncbi:phytoene/squalene synthase family protein [Gemmobacter serpentinus]|uniref:phytoene/squalene synthase family protein n=1 Tax=Gemmobacter serpentinus TaxID=2652247 RepID=UPI00124C23DF|nr:squalene/phytoene synthase family protein [Gemmobacter serpentinus]
MSIEACAEIVQRSDPERFAALMAAPVGDRATLAVLYAFNAELARAPWASKEPMIAEMRLQWWRDVIEAEAQGPAQPHEVASPLGKLIRTKALPLDLLDGMAAARQWDIYRDPHADEAGLWAYLEATGGALMQVSALALGAAASSGPSALALGTGQALANYLRAVPKLEELGRVPLLDGTRAGVAALARAGLLRLAEARQPLPRGAALAAYLTRPVLEMAVRDPALVAEGKLVPTEFTRRKRLLWQSLTGHY